MSSRTILLVEDSPDDIELTVHAFRKNHMTNDVVVAKDGIEALDYLFATGQYTGRDPANVPALILLDLKLPKLGGLEVLKRVRNTTATRRIPVVILTTSDDNSDIVNGYNLGANSYICKPVNFSDFTRVVEQLKLYWLILNTPAPD